MNHVWIPMKHFRYSKSFTLTHVDDSRVYFRAETNVSIVRDTISVFPIRI